MAGERGAPGPAGKDGVKGDKGDAAIVDHQRLETAIIETITKGRTKHWTFEIQRDPKTGLIETIDAYA